MQLRRWTIAFARERRTSGVHRHDDSVARTVTCSVAAGFSRRITGDALGAPCDALRAPDAQNALGARNARSGGATAGQPGR